MEARSQLRHRPTIEDKKPTPAKSGSRQVPNSFLPLALHADAPLYIPGAKTRIPAEPVTCEHIDSEAVHRDVQALRDTGYFEQVRLRVEDSPVRPNGKIIAFDVKEKPIVRRIEYRGIGSITESDVVHAFKEHRITLSEGSQFDERELRRAATVIQELLSKRGRPSAVVKPTYEINRNANVAIILFTIDERPKA